MTYENDEWRLPHLKYSNPNSLRDGRRIYRFCHDIRHFFEVPSDRAQFTATVELVGHRTYKGKRGDTDVLGFQWVLVTECQPDGCPEDLPLSINSQLDWKDLTFFADWVEQLEEEQDIECMRMALQYVQPNSTLRSSLSDPRIQIGWFKKAASLLVNDAREDGAEETGQVIQQQMTMYSTLLKVSSSLGWYFAKSPAWGLNECSITAEIAKLFPESSPKILMSVSSTVNS